MPRTVSSPPAWGTESSRLAQWILP
jgi:hypothetical protein